MIIFSRHNTTQAVECAADGEQSLCVGRTTVAERKEAPPPFCHAKEWGQLFDHDFDRLIQTARDLGACPVRMMFRGDEKQSVLLCGDPLRRAKRRSGDADS